MLLSLLLAATVGGASSGPDLEERAAAVDLPVEHVMVFSDRARITRAGKVKVAPGVVVVRAPDLPGAVMLDTLRVTATGATVVRVETKPIERERWSIDQVDQWLADLEQIADKINLAQGRLQVAHNELAMLSNLDAALPVPEKDRKATPVIAPDAWRALQDRLGQRRGQARTTEKNLERELRDLQLQYDKARREVQKRDLGGYTDRRIELLAILESDGGGAADVSVEYAVPGAFWKPAYDLLFDPDKKTVELHASGLVTQATGEDWPNIKLALSTAIPGAGIAMPTLETWTLGDDREWIPVATPKAPPRTTRPFLAPAPKPRIADLEKDADRQVLLSRSQVLIALAQSTTPPVHETVRQFDFTSEAIEGELTTPSGGQGMGSGYGSAARPMPKPSMPRPPMVEAPPPPPEPREYDAPMAAPAADEAEESLASKTISAAGGLLQSITGGERAEAVNRRGLSILAEPLPMKQTFSDPTLPAMSAGGLDYVYDAPVTTTIPSQADSLRVPLAERSYDVQTFYEATPSLATTAYLKATVKNGSKLPILAGPANIFVKRTFAGDAQLATTGPGGVLELPLGADEDIRLTRTVVPATKTQGFIFGKEDVTDYVVTIDVGNYKKHAVTVRVVDQIPKTNEEKVKVELVSASPQSVEAPNGEGLLYWHVDIPAGATKKVTFTFRVTRPKDWRLSQ